VKKTGSTTPPHIYTIAARTRARQLTYSEARDKSEIFRSETLIEMLIAAAIAVTKFSHIGETGAQ